MVRSMRAEGGTMSRRSIALLAVSTAVIAAAGYAIAGPSYADAATQRWQPVNLSLTTSHDYPNPYRDVSVSATFRGPAGTDLTVPGFFTEGHTWLVRFAPPQPGTWTYRTTSADPELNGQTGSITATDNTNPLVHGAIEIDPARRHQFRYADGTHYLPLQYEIDWLALMDFGDPNIGKAKALVDQIGGNGFSEVLMNVYGYDTSWTPGDTGPYDFGPPTRYPWAGTNANPDHSRMNEAYWQNVDRVIDYLYQKGITAHLFLKVYNKQVNWPAKNSADEEQYFRYVTARYQAYPGIVWDFAKEVFYEKDQAYLADRLALIGRVDAYHHLRTMHDPDAGATNGGYMTNPAIAANVDFLTDQHANAPTTIYSDAVGKREAFNMPITNSEYSYQVGNDGGHTYNHVSSQQDVLRDTLEVIMAGAFPGYYYTYHAWDVVKYHETPAGMGAYRKLARYLRTRTGLYDLAPNDALIGGGTPLALHMLASPGREYLGYVNGGTALTFTIAGVPAGTSLVAEWYNANSGAVVPAGTVGNGSRTFTPPWKTFALLHLAPAN
jgi:hypothetical protein